MSEGKEAPIISRLRVHVRVTTVSEFCLRWSREEVFCFEDIATITCVPLSRGKQRFVESPPRMRSQYFSLVCVIYALHSCH